MKKTVHDAFLGSGIRPEEEQSLRILVLGGDALGWKVAERLASEGFEVLLTGDAGQATSQHRIARAPDAVLEELRGFVGCFDAILRRASGTLTERVGFVVAAQPARVRSRHKEHGLSRSDRLPSLSDLEERLQSGDTIDPAQGAWLHVAFLWGLAGESEPSEFRRVLDCIETLSATDRVQPYIFTRNVKVAGAGLERRYREARERGTLFFKFDAEGPIFEETGHGTMMVFTDPLLDDEMELVPDILVVDEQRLPPTSSGPLLDAIPSSPAYAPYLKPDSTRFPGVGTLKAGVFAVGPSRCVFDPDLVAGDLDALVVALRQAQANLPDGSSAELPGPAHVDPERCTLCLTCVRLCPHGAIGFHAVAEADPRSCVRCGICAVVCPMKAISLAPPHDGPDLYVRIRDAIACARQSPKIVGFLCKRSAAQALPATPVEIRRGMLPLLVPCAGTVDLAHLLHAFESGADGVVVAGCFRGNCASVYGTVLAEERVTEARRILGQVGIDAERLRFVPMAANTPTALVQAVKQLITLPNY